MKIHELKCRLLISTLSLAGLFVLLYLSVFSWFHPVFALALAALIFLCQKEFCAMAKVKGGEISYPLLSVCSFVYVAAVLLGIDYPQYAYLPRIVLLSSVFVFFIHQLLLREQPLQSLSSSCFALVYITVPLAMILPIVMHQTEDGVADGRIWFVYLFVVTKMSDVGGYIIGNLFGKRKLAVNISPGKTVAGAVGGFCLSVLASLVFWYFGSFERGGVLDFSLWEALLLGWLLAIVGQVGDLAESMLKRDVAIKNSSSIPGMGGFLDMVDSLLFTIPVIYLFLKL